MATITILGAFFIRPFPPEEYLINPSVIGGNIISSFLQLPLRAKKSFESLKASSNAELSLLSHYQHMCKKHLFPIHIYPTIAQNFSTPIQKKKIDTANLKEKILHCQFRNKLRLTDAPLLVKEQKKCFQEHSENDINAFCLKDNFGPSFQFTLLLFMKTKKCFSIIFNTVN